MKKNNNKGFTLAELLIVVAIIAVLVAISIPIFSTQLEKSREAVDASNIRAKYAEMMTDVLTEDYNSAANAYAVALQQKEDNWQNTNNKTGLQSAGMSVVDEPVAGKSASLWYKEATSTESATAVVTFEQ